MNKLSVRGIVAGLLAGSLLPAGCSREDKWVKNRPKVYATSGVVRQDGRPLADAIVTFQPKEGVYGGTASTDAEGRYQLTTFKDFDGVTAGEFSVAIEKIDWIPIESAEKTPPADGGVYLPPLKKVPRTAARYADSSKSGLTAVVTAEGPNVFDYELDSKAR